MSDSDDDDLPTLSTFNYLIGATRKKTFDELFSENSILIENLKREPHHLEHTAEIPLPETLYEDDNPILGDPLLDNENEGDNFVEPSVRLFGEINHLQFITWDDLTLVKCGFDSTLDLSEQEKVLLTLNEEELHKEIECCETFSLKKVKQLKLLVQYVFKTMSLHHDEGYVRACQKFIKKTIFKWHYIKDFSISYTAIFMVLFNYGIDVKREIFNLLPGANDIQRKEIVNEIPQNWIFNLKAVLSSIGDLMKHCRMKEEEFYKIFIYMLWISMDDFIKINSRLQQCTAIILSRFSKAEWPDWRWKIAQFVISTHVRVNIHWNSVFKMIQCISYEGRRGFELRNYISYLSLVKLTDGTQNSNVIPEYSKKLFRAKMLPPILESICDIKKRLQLVAIKFISLFISSLKLNCKDEHYRLCLSLKRCENSISKHATIQQSQLCIIHSRISIMTPSESMNMDHDDVSDEEGNISGDGLETESDAFSSPLDKQLLSEDSKESFVGYDSNDMSTNVNINPKSIITNQRESQEITEESPPCSLNKQFMDDNQKMKSVCETPNEVNDDKVAMEITVNNAVQSSAEKNSDDKLEVSSKRLNTEPDKETNSSPEIADYEDKMGLNHRSENSVSPSKSFLIDHCYSRKKQNSVSPSKITAAVSSEPFNDQLYNKIELKILKNEVNALVAAASINASPSANHLLVTDVEESTDMELQNTSNVNPDVPTFAKKIEEMRNTPIRDSENHTSSRTAINMKVAHSVCAALSNQSQLEIQNDSAQSKTLQDITSSQNLNSPSVSENEVGCEIEKIITELTHQNFVMNESSCLSSLIGNIGNISTSLPEKLSFLENNNDTCTKKCENVLQANAETIHNFPGVIPVSQANAENLHNFPGVIYILPPPTTGTSECSNNDTNKSDEKRNIGYKLLNVENDQNLVSVLPKDMTDKFQSISTHLVISSDAIKETSELVSTSTNPVIKKTDEYAKASSEDLTKTEKITSSTIITPGINVDPLYPDLIVNQNTMDVSISTTKKLRVENHFIPRSVHVRADKAMSSLDLRVGQQSEKESTSDLQNSSSEKNEIFNISERDTDIFSVESNVIVKKRKIVIPSIQISENSETEIDMLNNQSETNVKVRDSFQSNTVLIPVENIEGSNIGKINSSDNEKHKNLSMPSLNQNVDENNREPTNKSVIALNFDHHNPVVDHQNMTVLCKQPSQAEHSSKSQPQSFEFPNASCAKRKHADTILHLASKKVRLPKTLRLRNWSRNFLTSLPHIENFNKQKDTEMYPVGPIANNTSSSVYSTEICNLQLANKIPATRETSEVTIDHSSEADSQTNSSIDLHLANKIPTIGESSENSIDYSINTEPKTNNSADFCLPNKIPGIEESFQFSVDHSSHKEPKTNSAIDVCSNNLRDSIASSSRESSSSSSCSSSSNPCETRYSYSQTVRKVVDEFIESVSSGSDDDIQIIEELSNIKTSVKNKSNDTLPSHVMNERQEDTFLNRMRPKSNLSSLKAKSTQPSIVGYIQMPDNQPVSLYNLFQKHVNGKQRIQKNSRTPKKSVKVEPRTPKKFGKVESKICKKSGNSEQRTPKKCVNPRVLNLDISLVKKTIQTSDDTEPHASTSIPKFSTKASKSQNQNEDNQDDSDCCIIEMDDDSPEIIHID